MDLVQRVARRFEMEAASKPNKADVELIRPLDPRAFELLVEEGSKPHLHFTEARSDLLHLVGPEDIGQKNLTGAFVKAWGNAGFKARQENLPGAGGLSLLHTPKLDFSKYTQRDNAGKYMHTKWTRLCKCGHPVGIHAGEKQHGTLRLRNSSSSSPARITERHSPIGSLRPTPGRTLTNGSQSLRRQPSSPAEGSRSP